MIAKKRIAIFLALVIILICALPVPAAAALPEGTAAVIEATAQAENISKYGNVYLSTTREELMEAGYQFGDVLNVSFLDQTLELPLCSNFTDVDSGSAGIFARARDICVALSINMGDFATTYGIAVKTSHEDQSVEWNYAEGIEGPVAFRISLKEAGGYYDEYVMHQLSHSNDRGDYPHLTDEQFANFRPVTTTGMGGVLFRGSTPLNPGSSRAACAEAAFRAAGVTVVMNLADDPVSVRSLEGYADSYYAAADTIELNMGVDFSTEDFQTKLADGLRFFAEHPGVYAVHCVEGKDRTGFVIALLEFLMGASSDEVIADYMVTYYNFYGVTKDDARYETIANSNIVKSF
ncbi:MAG: tyrosine-protein phosphatase [Oscillospiraceae bacterium]|nr:tyrosine-protein phosphatase [Oscillospiraceae bacterium]